MVKSFAVTTLLLAIGTGMANAMTADEYVAILKAMDRERKLLYTACASMDFMVEDMDPEDVRETGLTKDAIMNAVESRLRSARLFASIDA